MQGPQLSGAGVWGGGGVNELSLQTGLTIIFGMPGNFAEVNGTK